MALDSVGFGIGLQAQAKDYSGIAMHTLAANKARDKAEAAAKAKNEEEFNKLITSKDFIQQAGNFHKLYKGQAAKEVTDFFNRAIQMRKDDPNNYLPSVVADFQQTQMKLNNLKQNSDKVFAYEKSMADPNKNANTYWDRDFVSSVNKGEFNSAADWGKVKAIPGMGVLFNPQTGDFNAEPPLKITDDEVIKDFSDTKNMQEVSVAGSTVPGTGGDILAITTTSKVRPEVIQNRAEAWSNNPEYVRSKAIEWGVDMSDPDWMKKTQAAVKQHVIDLSGISKTDISTQARPKSGGGGGGTTVINMPSAYNYPEGVYAPEKYVAPVELLNAPGLGDKSYSWDQATEKMNTATSDKDKAEFSRLRSSAAKARAGIMYNAYLKDGGSPDREIAGIINKTIISDDDFNKLQGFFRDKKIKTESVKNQMMQGKGVVSTQAGTQYENWLSSYSSSEPGTKKIVSTVNIEDVSRLKNAPQNFDVVENGIQKTLSNAEFLGVDKLADGTREVRVKHNNKIKRYPYNDAWGEQISKKYKIDITKLNLK